jgi:hypothetical protein
MHQPIPEQGQWLAPVVRGYFAYHAVPTNVAALNAFLHYVKTHLDVHAPATSPIEACLSLLTDRPVLPPARSISFPNRLARQ